MARSLAAGRGFLRNCSLGGNPLFDLVHAAALCALQNRAAERFAVDYTYYLRNVAARIDRRNQFGNGQPEWWNSFYMYLTGIASEKVKPALDSFSGYSGLKNWLRIALAIFLRKYIGRERLQETLFTDLDETKKTETEKEDDNESTTICEPIESFSRETKSEAGCQDLIEHLIPALRLVRARISDEDWNRLLYHFVEKLQNQQIARLYAEDGGTTSRKREKAIHQFRKEFSRVISEDPVLRDFGNAIFTTWGNETGSIIVAFFKMEGGTQS